VEAAQLEGKVNIVFAGNIGRAQALDVLLKAAPGIPPGVQIVVVGAGVERERLVLEASQAGLSNLLFLPARPAAEIGAILMAADALLVHLKDDPLFEITIPSKIQAYLAAGKPVLAGVRGDAAQMVVDAGAGFTFAPEDPEDLVRAIRDFLALTPEARRALGTAGAAYYCNRLSLDTGIERFEDVFTRVSAGV
jgi:glycosyltransferase involved in cell wall biosynthesis